MFDNLSNKLNRKLIKTVFALYNFISLEIILAVGC